MSIDSSEIDKLAHDLGTVPARVIPKIKPVVSKGALNIKNQMVKDAQGSQHFSAMARVIDYDLFDSAAFGTRAIQAEIGPNPSLGGAAGLMGAYWGWANGGGGTLPDPSIALADEEPKFIMAMSKIAGFIFD